MRREYPQEYKAALVEKILAGQSTRSLSNERITGAPPRRNIQRWVKESQNKNKKTIARKIKRLFTGEPTTKPIEFIQVPPQKTQIVLAIPDMHHPFCHPDSLSFLKAVKTKFKPTEYVCLGDEIDAASLSKYPQNPDGMAPGHELRAAIENLIPFYLEFPKMKVCESNHTVRGHKKAFLSGLPEAFLKHISTILNAPDGWEWRHHWEIDGVRYFHGDAGRSGQYAHLQYLKMFKKNIVIGHIHSYAGVSWEGDKFAVNSGCLIDEDAYCFAYAKNMPIRPNLGCTIIYEGKWAVFIPMLLDEAGKWIGRI